MRLIEILRDMADRLISGIDAGEFDGADTATVQSVASNQDGEEITFVLQFAQLAGTPEADAGATDNDATGAQ